MIKSVFLQPGQLHVSTCNTKIITILGTCVAVCLMDPVLKIGGMNHYMLPRWNDKSLNKLNYGNSAIQALIDKMIGNGAHKERIVAGIFGGFDTHTSVFNIGQQNALIALEILKAANIKIVSKNTGGKHGRKLNFYTFNQSILVERFKMNCFGKEN
ncbi:chemotaxis protein CheD [Fulvivirga ligni]|uniref:chemotaxis protein CheD n=1 Tax=Fulvivirga ligni TaxID=2904246 RepID=UPI001F160394|nr:chemotaxis protein CheD [Fulvivirga ligni]UII19042.1 chemotaxis protein CheD [Fulvivirga ligni]